MDVLGASADTFSKVVGAFFVGLALGAWGASRPAPPRANFWRRVALAELSVALLAVPVLFSVELTGWLHATIAPGRWLKLALPLLFVTPPSTTQRSSRDDWPWQTGDYYHCATGGASLFRGHFAWGGVICFHYMQAVVA